MVAWTKNGRKRRDKHRLVWLLVLHLGLAGCNGATVTGMGRGFAPVPTTEIARLQKPAAQDSLVYVRGRVGDRVPLAEGAVYELQDSTGKIWVLTKGEAPQNGQEVVVQGTLRFKSIVLNDQEQGSLYLEQVTEQ